MPQLDLTVWPPALFYEWVTYLLLLLPVLTAQLAPSCPGTTPSHDPFKPWTWIWK